MRDKEYESALEIFNYIWKDAHAFGAAGMVVFNDGSTRLLTCEDIEKVSKRRMKERKEK